LRKELAKIASPASARLGMRGALCMDARGLRDEDLVAGAHRSSMEELTRWTLEADKPLVF